MSAVEWFISIIWWWFYVLAIWDTSEPFPQWLHQLLLVASLKKLSSFSTSLSVYVTFFFYLIKAILTGVRWNLKVIWICISTLLGLLNMLVNKNWSFVFLLRTVGWPICFLLGFEGENNFSVFYTFLVLTSYLKYIWPKLSFILQAVYFLQW